MLGMAYKIALGLPRSTPNRVVWKFCRQPSLKQRITHSCDKFICKTFQLGNNKIRIQLKNLFSISTGKGIAPRNIPFIVNCWPIVSLLFDHLYKWDLHPAYSYPLNINSALISCDITSGKE